MIRKQQCPLCGKSFVSLQKHISKNKNCKESLLNINYSSKKQKISIHTNQHVQHNVSLRNESMTYTNDNTYHSSDYINNNNEVSSTFSFKKLDHLNVSQTCKQLIISSNNPLLSRKHKISLELYKILHKVNAPISLYKDISMFISRNSRVIGNSTDPIIIPRDNLINQMHEFVCLQKKPSSTKERKKEMNVLHSLPNWKFDLSPKHVNLQLTDCKFTVSVPKFDFVSAFLNLMHDPSIVGDSDNLLYNTPEYLNPNHQQNSQNVFIDDLYRGSWFKDTHQSIISDVEKEIICPIILYIDGVSIDNYGRKSLEPISFTLGWFSKKIRNMQKCWRVLGYIPNVERMTSMDYNHIYGNQKMSIKKNHYHEIIHCILSELQDVQQRGGIQMMLPFQFCTKEVLVKFPISFIVGDTIGNDKLCSRYQKYVPTQLENTGVSRDCTCTYKYAGTHNYKCCFLSRQTIKKLPVDVSRRLGFNNTTFNAFDEMSFGCSKLGINGHTPPEMLHQWYLGIVPMFIKYFLDHITSKCKEKLDLIIQNMARNNCRQSDRSQPNIRLFRNGIDKVKLTGSEKGTQLFMLWLALIPTDHRQYLINIELSAPQKYKIVTSENVPVKRMYFPKILETSRKYNCWVNIFESMLSIGEWLRSSSVSIDRRDVEPIHDIILCSLHGYEAWQNNLVSLHDESTSQKRIIEFSEIEVHDTTCHNSSSNSFQDPNVFSQHDVFKYQKSTSKVSRAEIGIRVFMKQIRDLINKQDRILLKNGKFHQLLHYLHYIQLFGSPTNFDGSIPESMNKEFAKNTGKRTQLRNESINHQCAQRYYENNIIGSSWNKMKYVKKKKNSQSTNEQDVIVRPYNISGVYSFTFNVDDDLWKHMGSYQSHFNQYIESKSKYIKVDLNINKLNTQISKTTRMILMKILILTLIRNNVITQNMTRSDDTMELITQLNCYSHITFSENFKIHSALEYYSDESWMDWVLINWGDEGGILPAKMLCIFEAQNLINRIQHHSNKHQHHSHHISSLLECSTWCLVRSASNILSNEKVQPSTLFSSFKMTDELSIVTIDSVLSGTYILDRKNYYLESNTNHDDESSRNRLFDMNVCSEVILVRNRDEWGTNFMDKCDPFDRFKSFVESD